MLGYVVFEPPRPTCRLMTPAFVLPMAPAIEQASAAPHEVDVDIILRRHWRA